MMFFSDKVSSQISPEEMKEVVSALSGQVDKLYAEGLHVASERYVVTKAEGRSVYGRKVRHTHDYLLPTRQPWH